jgi:hypothetical protein
MFSEDIVTEQTVNGCKEKYVQLTSAWLRHFAKPLVNISPSVTSEFIFRKFKEKMLLSSGMRRRVDW